MENPNIKKPLIGKIFQFDKIATAIGFIVDCITIISILFTIKIGSEIDIPFAKFISPELALGIWVITAYTYFAYLHRQWDKYRVEKEYNEYFGKFIGIDLIRNFRNPILLLPLIVLLVILIAIIVASNTLLAIFGVVIIFLFALSPFVFMILDSASGNKPIDKASKEIIEKNWDYLKKRIKVELSQKSWIDIYYLRDVAELLQIDVSTLSYAFAKYAFDNAGKTKYGSVCRFSDGEIVTGQENVLVNIETLNREKYYFSS